MKYLEKIILTLALFLSVTAAFAADVTFTSVEQAEIYCPAKADLKFTPNNPSNPISAGKIVGHNHVTFESIPQRLALHPNNMNSKGFIQDAQFRRADGIYGYMTNKVFTCFYSYANYFGTE